MKDYLSAEAKNVLNDLIRDMFKANSKADNLCYCFQQNGYFGSAKFYHETIAHSFGQLADGITEVMDKLGTRAYRLSFDGDTESYDDPIEIYRAFVRLLEDLRMKNLSALESLDYDIGTKEVVLELEDISRTILDMLYGCNKVLEYAEYYNERGKLKQMDIKVKDFYETDD